MIRVLLVAAVIVAAIVDAKADDIVVTPPGACSSFPGSRHWTFTATTVTIVTHGAQTSSHALQEIRRCFADTITCNQARAVSTWAVASQNGSVTEFVMTASQCTEQGE